MSTTSNNPTVSITNKLSYSVDIYDVFNPSEGSEKRPYEYTKLATIEAGKTVDVQTIRSASMLQAMYTGTFTKLNNNYYYQFPIKVMAAVQFSFDNPPPITYTIEQADEDAMLQSFLFHRFTMANPNSALTKNLYNALKGGSSKSINEFFQGTKNFQNCTLSSWNAIMTWLQMFTSGWQGPYYLYEKAPNPAPSGYVPTLVATLDIVSKANKNSATLTMCSADSEGNPVFSNPLKTSNIVMNGDGTMGDENPGADIPVNLTPVWMNVIQTTMQDGKPVSNYLVGPTVTGTVANKEVVSSQTARQLPGKGKDKKKESTFDSAFNKICQSVGLLVGLIMLGEFAGKIFKSKTAKTEKAKEDAKSEEDFKAEEKTIDSTSDPDVVKEAASAELQVTSDAQAVADSYQETSKALQEDTMTQTMEETQQKIESEMTEQMEDGETPTPEFEEAVSDMQASFKEVQEDISKGKLSDASTKLSDASEKIEQTLEESSEAMEEWEQNSLKESSEAVDQAAQESDALDQAQEDYEEDMDDESEDSGFDEDEDFAEGEDIPFAE